MLLRNATVISIAAVVSLMCYQKAQSNRYASTISEALAIIDQNYVEPVEPRELFEAAMNGMTSQLDPYSSYIPPVELTEFQASLDQEFGGIGVMVELDPRTKRPTVISPIFDTPAYRAGMRSGDTILKIDDHDTEGMPLTKSVELIHGVVGEPVRLTILHAGETEPVELTIVRAVIRTDSVLGDTRNPDGSWNFFLEEDPRILLLRVTTFGERTAEELQAALASKNSQGRTASAAIIDLRDNAGGLLTAAVDAADLFLDEGVIVSTRTRGGVEGRRHTARAGSAFDKSKPIVILTNKYTASAAEILAACLQDHGRAVVVGQRSWGKGTVQNVIQLEGGRSALKITTASYWRPSNRNIHRMRNAKDEDEWGVMPDQGLEVPMDDELATKVGRYRRYRDQLQAEKSGIRASGSPSGSTSAPPPAGTPAPPKDGGEQPSPKPNPPANEQPRGSESSAKPQETPNAEEKPSGESATDVKKPSADSVPSPGDEGGSEERQGDEPTTPEATDDPQLRKAIETIVERLKA